MPLKTPEEYLESIKRDVNLYMFGEKIEEFWNHPIILPSINSVKKIYELAQIDEYKDLMTTKSHLTGEIINRFTHIHQSTDDLIKKVKMQRLIGQKVACCYQRCVGFDAANALYSVTYEIDKKNQTNYHERFKKYWIEVSSEYRFNPKLEGTNGLYAPATTRYKNMLKNVNPEDIVLHYITSSGTNNRNYKS